MSVSKSVRMALTKAEKRQGDLTALWDTTPQAVSNKFRLDRWSAEDLVQMAAYTGGKLAFIYPDGQEILIDTVPDPKQEPEASPKKGKAKAAPKSGKAKAPAKPKEKKAPAKPKKAKTSEVMEEQISFFG